MPARLDWRGRSLEYRQRQVRPTELSAQRSFGSRFALFVHGFNNDREDAENNYGTCLERFGNVTGLAHQGLLRDVWGLFWPSWVESVPGWLERHRTKKFRWWRDQEIPTHSSLVRTLPTYSLQVSRAIDVGVALGAFLREVRDDTGRPSQTVLVGHSLGCRVIVEALRELAVDGSDPSVRVPAVLLMAAAVPSFMLDPHQRFWRIAATTRRTYVLHSRRDVVLRLAFPPGQAAAGEGIWPEAVGRYGRPKVWTADDSTMLGHGEYWGSPVTKPYLARTLGLATTCQLKRFELVDWERPEPARLAARGSLVSGPPRVRAPGAP